MNVLMQLELPRVLPETTRGLVAYLGGPISGIKDSHLRFRAAQGVLSLLGYQAVRIPFDFQPWPHELGGGECPGRTKAGHEGDHGYACHVRGDLIGMLVECHHVWMLPGWQHSEGARHEVATAGICGMPLYFLEYGESDGP